MLVEVYNSICACVSVLRFLCVFFKCMHMCRVYVFLHMWAEYTCVFVYAPDERHAVSARLFLRVTRSCFESKYVCLCLFIRELVRVCTCMCFYICAFVCTCVVAMSVSHASVHLRLCCVYFVFCVWKSAREVFFCLSLVCVFVLFIVCASVCVFLCFCVFVCVCIFVLFMVCACICVLAFLCESRARLYIFVQL